jgi:hypothetical protein
VDKEEEDSEEGRSSCISGEPRYYELFLSAVAAGSGRQRISGMWNRKRRAGLARRNSSKRGGAEAPKGSGSWLWNCPMNGKVRFRARRKAIWLST